MLSKINKTIEFVKQTLEGAEAGHDWFHTERVWKLSKIIANREGGDDLIIQLAALLHDIADAKFHNGNEMIGVTMASEFLHRLNLDETIIGKILFIIKYISFKNRNELTEEPSLELKIVQDADRLDAIGAIGIARAFNFGGFKNNLIYHPDIKPNIYKNKVEYKLYNGTTINHFYEKLLLLKDLMNTTTAREIAEERHHFMLLFLEKFYEEWNVINVNTIEK